MRNVIGIVLGSLLLISGFAACGKDDPAGPQQVKPSVLGQRGESCQARNDCQDGLACVRGTCSKNDFEIAVTAKQCDLVECQADKDCCGNKPLEAPAKCASFESKCTNPTIDGCSTVGSCSSNADCGGGTCGTGICSNFGTSCTTDAECLDTCSLGNCRVSGDTCASDAECQTGFTPTCFSRECNCANPAWDPTDPVCSDPDCSGGVCQKRCSQELCVQDDSCKSDAECVALSVGYKYCTAGACAQCKADSDCDENDGEKCTKGICKKPCTKNEGCPLFSACEAGECIPKGCQSDRDCIIAFGSGVGASGSDARLMRCLEVPGLTQKQCRQPCENDAECATESEVCEAGFCKFVGCENDEQCRGEFANRAANQVGTVIPTAVCREPKADSSAGPVPSAAP